MARKDNKDKPEKTEEAQEKSRIAKVLGSEIFQSLKKQMGSTAVMSAADVKYQDVPRISSGIFALDYALAGGWQAGRVHTIFGQKSASKTTTLLKTIAEAQKLCARCYTPPAISPDGEVGKCACGDFREMICAFVDVEGTFDHKWSRKLGVQSDRLLYSQPEYAEQSLDIVETLVRSGEVDLVVLDSLAFLAPKSEIEHSVEKESVGVQARLIGKSVRKLNAALATVKNEQGLLPTIFFTNQIRMKVGVMFGSPETVSGGMAPGFMATTEVKVRPGKYEMDEVTGKPLSATMHFRIEKSKSSPTSHMEGEFKLVLSDTEIKKVGEIDEEGFMVKLAQTYGIVEGSGSSWTCLGEKFPGKSPIERRLATDPTMKAKLREMLIKALLVS